MIYRVNAKHRSNQVNYVQSIGKIEPMNLKTYLKTLERDLARGNATEHTHRSTLKQLLEDAYADIVATNEPKRIKAGAPDYVIQKVKHLSAISKPRMLG
jgi:hypothetical protein